MPDFYTPRNKKEIVNWLYWFYDGQYTKTAIKKKDVRGWYFGLRYNGARKQVASSEEKIKLHCGK